MPLEPESPPSVILLVEDNEDDVLLIRRGFERSGVGSSLQLVKNGPEAIAYLKSDLPYHDRSKHPLPSLVLLDIKMPGVNGFEVLKWIRRQPEFVRLQVVMLTSSDEIRDVTLAYQLGANSFFVKPVDLWNAAELWRAIERLVAGRDGLFPGTRPNPRPRI